MQKITKNPQQWESFTIPVLVLSGYIYPSLGGDFPGNTTLNSTQALAENVKGAIVPYSGHWIPEEQPDFVIAQLSKFFGNSNNEIK
jgi:pimeloyl-ACP methyl ester carboxylesterase